MAKSKKKVSDKKGSRKEEFDVLSPLETSKAAHTPEAQKNGHERMNRDDLKDRHNPPLNTPPKGMDA